ncbi:thioredoxin domain-containing protein [Micrococcales bacterium 31B]|nr:thioredoxin domain-containing protein [Micrococcales bacterium 31B]
MKGKFLRVSAIAAYAAYAADEQGKFPEMYAALFANQATWMYTSTTDTTVYSKLAADIGLDVAQFEKDFGNATAKQRLEDSKADLEGKGIVGAPMFIINGEVQQQLTPDQLEAAIQAAVNGQ